MRTKSALFVIIAILSLGTGCEKNNVPYGKCDCLKMEKADLNLTNAKAVLLIVSTDEEEMKLQLLSHDDPIDIIYNRQSDMAHIIYRAGCSVNICRICNFPDFAKKWNVSDKGQDVYFEGQTYLSCQEFTGHTDGLRFYYDYVLTTLMKK